MKRRAYCVFCDNGETFIRKNIVILYRNEVWLGVRFWNSLELMTYAGGREKIKFEVLTGKCSKNGCCVCVQEMLQFGDL